MAKTFIEELKEYTTVLVGPRKVSSWCGKVGATYKQRKGYGQLVINVGTVKLGDDCERQIDNQLESLVRLFERLHQVLQERKDK